MKKYKNKEWLREQYSIKKLSTRQIGRLCNCSCFAILYWLKKLNISRRTQSKSEHLAKANHCNLSKKARQWIDGELLGDAYLRSRSQYSANFQYSSKYKEYIQYISNTLKFFSIQQAGEIYEEYNIKMDCYTYHYQSFDYIELLPIRKRWYPKGHKIIPRDLELTPLVCRQWYIGDGCLVHSETGKPRIQLCTNGFPVLDVEWLVKELNKSDFKSTQRPSSNTIGISTYSTKQFLGYIGKSPVKCYKYKWKY